MTVINTNVKSLVAQQALSINGRSLATAMERLSTGQKINSAKDDAAGLAISTRMTSQVRGLNMAIKNANDGMSLLQTAEGAMNEVTNMVQRMRELAVQAATDTVSVNDRSSMNDEITALQAEINRIAATTKFNGFNILDGSFKGKTLQIGDSAGQTLGVSIENVESASLGVNMPLAKGVVVGDRTTTTTGALANMADDIIINGTAINIDNLISDPDQAGVFDVADVVKGINNAAVGVTAEAYNEVVARTRGSGISASGDISITTYALDTGTSTVITLGATNSLQEVVNQINAQGGASTVLARLDNQGKLTLYNNSGASIEVTTAGSTTVDINGVAVTTTGFEDADEFGGFIKLSSNNGQPFSVDYVDDADAEKLGINQARADGTIVGTAALDATGFDYNVWLSGSMHINGVDIWSEDMDISGALATLHGLSLAADFDANTEFVKAINSFTAQTGVVAGLSSDGTDYFLALSSINGAPIQLQFSEEFKTGEGGAMDGTINLMEQNVGAVDYDGNIASLGYFAGGGNVASANVLTQETASKAIEIMDGALEQVSRYRSGIGAQVNRLTSTVDNLANVVTNTEASRSRILDTDYASETTRLAKAQIIQQAATAMLAQANQQPQTVLALLQ